MHAIKAQLLHAVEALLVGGPLFGGALVATQMHIVVGEHLGYMTQNALEEVDDAVVANVENVVRDTAIDAHLILLAWVATELGI